ncbi:MAG TPA: CBS domain-containing protein [Candidatus Luteimonas excrementigallinarum]|nr:CBS domain-containing protein [Candidatus Luteimonas excrementigallinarum]
MRTVRHLLEVKGHEVFAIDPDAAVIDAVRLMASRQVGSVLVMRGSTLEGMFSERDYARKVVLEGLSSKTTPVRDIMTREVVTVGLDDHVPHCMEIVTRQRIRHLPVVDAGGTVLGLVSIGDLVKAVIEDQQIELEQLHSYIAG